MTSDSNIICFPWGWRRQILTIPIVVLSSEKHRQNQTILPSEEGFKFQQQLRKAALADSAVKIQRFRLAASSVSV
jgi:hypothetical protein